MWYEPKVLFTKLLIKEVVCVRSNNCNMYCLTHLIRTRTVKLPALHGFTQYNFALTRLRYCIQNSRKSHKLCYIFNRDLQSRSGSRNSFCLSSSYTKFFKADLDSWDDKDFKNINILFLFKIFCLSGYRRSLWPLRNVSLLHGKIHCFLCS